MQFRYYKTFKEQNKMYIVMQHIDGAPLSEHFSSLREKGLSFSEERIWKIFVQVCVNFFQQEEDLENICSGLREFLSARRGSGKYLFRFA